MQCFNLQEQPDTLFLKIYFLACKRAGECFMHQ